MNRLMVMGSVNMDIIMQVNRMPMPGECMVAQQVTKQVGGKGLNQAVAAARCGAQTTYVGKVGADEAADEIRKVLSNEGIVPQLYLSRKEPTGAAYIMLDRSGQNRIIVHGGANQDFTDQDIARLEETIAHQDILLIQLETNLPSIEGAVKCAIKHKVPVIVDAGPARPGILELFSGVDVVSPNETELAELLGCEKIEPADRIAACRKILKHGAKAILLKLGSEGSLWVTADNAIFYPAYRGVKAIDTTGAGDAFTAAFACAVLHGESIDAAIHQATLAGAIAVTRRGALRSMPTKKEIEALSQEISTAG